MSSSSSRPKRAARELPRGAAADLWQRTVSQIPTVFGRLVYLASLRNANTGRYEHHGLALQFGDAESGEALRKSHEETFGQWLQFGLEEQSRDLDEYFQSLDTSKKELVENWLRIAPYPGFVPPAALAVDRELFVSDLETLLSLLRNEYGVAGPETDA